MVDVSRVFGTNLKGYRKMRHMSQIQLADQAEVHRTYISALEHGTGNPSLVIIEKIANVLEVETWRLLCYEKYL